MAKVTGNITSNLKTNDFDQNGDGAFQSLAELTASAIFIYQGTKFIYINPAAESLTGYTQQELLGMKCDELFSGNYKNQIRDWGAGIQTGNPPFAHGEFKISTKNGEERWVDLTTSAIDLNNSQAAIWTAFDITEHKRGEVLQDAVYRIALAADRSKGLDDLFSAVHAIIAEVMNADNFYIALFDSESNLLSFPYFVDELDVAPPPNKPGKGLTEYVLRTGASQLVDLAMHDQLCKQGEIELVGVPSPIWLGVPLIVDSEVIGVMVVQHYSNPTVYGDREKRILEFVSSQVAMVITRKRAEDAIRESEERFHRRADELAALYETGRDLANQKDLNTLLNTVADRVTGLLKSPGCTIYLYNEEVKELEGVISRGLPGMVGVRLKLGEGVAGRVAQTLQAMVVDDLRKWTGRSPKLADLNAIAVAAVPMVYSSKVIGVLTVYEIDKGDNPESRQYTQADLDLLAVFADTAAVAVNNARLFDETQQRLLEIQVLYQTSLAAIQINSVHSIAQRIVETLEQLMNWQNSSIWLTDAKNQKPRQIAHSNADTLENRALLNKAELIDTEPDENTSVVNLVCVSGQSILTGDVRTLSTNVAENKGTISILCVPLKISGKTIGCINVESRELHAFGAHDQQILSTLAAQAASAIDNANLYQEALRAAERRSILHQASQEIARSSQDPEEVYSAVHSAATQLMPADVFVITLFDESKQEIRGVYLIARGVRHPNNVFQVGQGISSKVITTGKSLLIPDFQISPQDISPYLFSDEGMTRSILAVPMRAGERIIGMISVQSYTPNTYTGDDATILEMLAAHAGAAIENARLFEETRRNLTELELLYHASLAAAQIHSSVAVAQRIVDTIEKLLKWNGSIWLVDDQKPIMLAHCSMGLSGEKFLIEIDRINNLITSLDDGVIGRVCKRGKTINTGNVNKLPYNIATHDKTLSVLCVPLKVGGKTIGCINLESEVLNAFNDHDERLLITLANQAAVALENARLFEETRRRASHQAVLNSIITVTALAGTDPAEIINTTLEQTLKALDLDMGSLWLSWSTRGVQRMASKNISPSISSAFANSTLMAGYSQTHTLVVDDWRTNKHKLSDLFVSAGIYSTIIVPLTSKENRIGGMAIASKDIHQWTLEEIALVEAIGREVGSAAERAKLFEETTVRLDELEAVNKVSKSLRLAQSLQEMLPLLMDETLKILDVKAGAIWLLNPERGKLLQAIGRGWCTQLAKLELDREESLPGKVFITGDIYFSHDVAQDSLTSESMRSLVPEGCSAICLPIHSEQEPIGILFASTKLPREFTIENAHLLVTLTEIAGNAIHRTRLNEQLVQHAAELEIRVNERTAELQSALQKAQAADQLKSEFIINVNHELRTPLTNLVLYYQMLRAQPTIKSAERLEVIGRELQRLRTLIEELLNLSRFDLGQVRPRYVPTDLNSLIQTLIDDRRSLAEERGLTLNTDLQPNLESVWIDEPTITQAVSNLLTNAMNYTPRGGNIVVSTMTELRDGESWVGCRVQDTGQGIDRNDLPHLFERFYRGKAGHDSGAPGTGLGLAIVKQVVDIHHGQINAENGAGGQGAIFTIWLPGKQPQETF
jgi:PAS domain S-box-containing protein